MSKQCFSVFYRPLFERVLELHRTGNTQTQIASLLSREGWRTQRGNLIDQVTVHRILKEAKEDLGEKSQSHLVSMSALPLHIQREISHFEDWKQSMLTELQDKEKSIQSQIDAWRENRGEPDPGGILGLALHRAKQATS